MGRLIGRHGQTIDALQHLAWRAAYHERDERKAVVVDAAGYPPRREEALQRQADRAASEARSLRAPGRARADERVGAQDGPQLPG